MSPAVCVPSVEGVDIQFLNGFLSINYQHDSHNSNSVITKSVCHINLYNFDSIEEWIFSPGNQIYIKFVNKFNMLNNQIYRSKEVLFDVQDKSDAYVLLDKLLEIFPLIN